MEAPNPQVPSQSLKAVPKKHAKKSVMKTPKPSSSSTTMKSSSISNLLTPGDRIMNKRGNLKFIVKKNRNAKKENEKMRKPSSSCRHHKK